MPTCEQNFVSIKLGNMRSHHKAKKQFFFGKKSIVKGIVVVSTTFIIGCATISYNARPNTFDTIKSERNDKTVSAERTVFYRGRHYTYRIEVKGEWVYKYWDGVLSSRKHIFDCIDEKAFGGKFEVKHILFGNPSVLWVGIDGKGNYAYVIQTDVMGPITYQSFKTELPVRAMEELGIRVEIKYEGKTRTWRTNFYNNKGKLVAYAIDGEDGRDIKTEDLGLTEMIKNAQQIKDTKQ